MTTAFDRFTDPDDLVGFTKRGVDKSILMQTARLALRARLEAQPLGLWTTPWRRAELTLRQLFGEEIDDASAMAVTTGAFRLYLLDFLSGCRTIALVSEEEFYAVADPWRRTPAEGDSDWTPPPESRLGSLYAKLKEARVFERPLPRVEVLSDWLAVAP